MLKKVFKRLGIGSGGKVLLYHRVAELACDPQLLAVNRQRFREQLQVIKNDWIPVSLGELLQRARDGKDTNRCVAITFDDGYADNLLNAAPLLSELGIPATIYVSTGFLHGEQEFFWDQLNRLIIDELPDHRDLNIELQSNGISRQWTIPLCGVSELSWDVTLAEAPTARHEVYRQLCGIVKVLPANERTETLSKIFSKFPQQARQRPEYRTMDTEELQTLSNIDGIEIGAHTQTHPTLSCLPVEEQQREIELSRKVLQEVTGCEIHTFSYPFGTKADYSPATIAAVQRAGFKSTCSNYSGQVHRRCSHFEVPRNLVRNWDAATFARRLSSF